MEKDEKFITYLMWGGVIMLVLIALVGVYSVYEDCVNMFHLLEEVSDAID
jgi:hypothetical protein